MLTKFDKIQLIRVGLHISEDDGQRIIDKFIGFMKPEDLALAEDIDTKVRKLVDEAPTLREAAFIGAVLGITMLDNIEKEPTLDWLDDKRRALLVELRSVERMIKEKGGK